LPHLQQFERCKDRFLEIGRYHQHSGRRWLIEMATGREIVLTTKEVALLKYLYVSRGAYRIPAQHKGIPPQPTDFPLD
jgi:hypothetical protein